MDYMSDDKLFDNLRKHKNTECSPFAEIGYVNVYATTPERPDGCDWDLGTSYSHRDIPCTVNDLL
jgi:hypothetical protein